MCRASIYLKKILLTLAAILIAMRIGTALADEEVIELVPVKQAEPEAIPVPWEPEITEHRLDQGEVEALAEFLWKSPLRYDSTKRELLWIVFNRIDDDSGLFADTIEEVCRNKREFTFMTAHRYTLSQENLKIVREEMNKWLSLKDGKWVGDHLPRTAVYFSFGGDRNRHITHIYDIHWTEVEYE